MKNNTTQTGGGPLIIKIDPVLEQVCSILDRGCTGILGVPDCDVETGPEEVRAKVICTENDLRQTKEEANVQITEALKNLETQREEILDRTESEIYECIDIDENSAEKPKADVEQPRTSEVAYNINNVYYKKKETVEDLKEQILREELEFKRKLYDLQLQAAVKEVEIETAILDQIRGGGHS